MTSIDHRPRQRAAPPTDPPIEDEARTLDVFESIAMLVTNVPPGRDRIEKLLEILTSAVGGAAGVISMTERGDEFETESLPNPAGAEWLPTIRPMALDAQANFRRSARIFAHPDGRPAMAIICAPIPGSGGAPIGGVAIAAPCSASAQAERQLTLVRAAAAHAGAVITARPPEQPSEVDVDAVTRVMLRATEYRSIEHFAFAITNALRGRLDCQQVALGLVQAGRIRVASVSGLDELKRRSPGVHRIQQAMGECADRGATIAAQVADRWEDGAVASADHLHRRWRAASGDAAVASVPILAGERVVAVLSIRRAASRPFAEGELESARRLVAPLAGAIPLVIEARRGTAARLARDLGRLASWSIRPGSLGRKALLLALGGALAWFTFGTADHALVMPATVVSDASHVVAAPLDGRVERMLVAPGELVEAGAVVARMDDTDLRFELDQVRAEARRLTLHERIAAGEDDPAAAALARAEAEALLARQRLLERRIAAAEVRAPVSGVVVAERPDLLEGRVVAVGTELITIARTDAIRLELVCTNGRAVDLPVGAAVRFISEARPEEPGDAVVERVPTIATERESGSVFLVEASTPANQPWLRPGMHGRARVDAGRRPVWWIASHSLIDAARLRFWLD